MNKRRISHVIAIAASMLIAISMIFLPSAVILADVSQPVLTIPTLDSVNCASYCAYDTTTGEILIGQNAHDRIYPASMTKIMTAQLGLDYIDPDAILTVSQNAIDNVTSDSTLMYVSVGEEVRFSELLYGMMLPSGNDAANVVAEGVIDSLFENYPAGCGEVGPDGVDASYITDALGLSSEEVLAGYKLSAFAELMNLRARNLGCTGTHFCNANGLHDDNHYSTAYDLTLIITNAVQNPDFCTVIGSPTHIFEGTNYHADGWSIVTNTNKLILDPWLCATTAEGEDSHISAFVGGKTGTTSLAGTGMTVYSVNENGHGVAVAVCGIPTTEYSMQPWYVASVTAYGNLACWESDPVSVLPGTLGDYQHFNLTVDERPVCDPIQVPEDTLPTEETEPEVEPSEEEETAVVTDETGGTVVDEEGNPVVERKEKKSVIGKLEDKLEASALGKFIKANPVISTIVAVLVILIIICVVALIVRAFKGKGRKKRKMRAYTGTPTL